MVSSTSTTTASSLPNEHHLKLHRCMQYIKWVNSNLTPTTEPNIHPTTTRELSNTRISSSLYYSSSSTSRAASSSHRIPDRNFYISNFGVGVDIQTPESHSFPSIIRNLCSKLLHLHEQLHHHPRHLLALKTDHGEVCWILMELSVLERTRRHTLSSFSFATRDQHLLINVIGISVSERIELTTEIR